MLPLPNKDNRGKQLPLVVDTSDELTGSAKKSAMSRFMNAVQGANVNDALDAMQDLILLCKSEG